MITLDNCLIFDGIAEDLLEGYSIAIDGDCIQEIYRSGGRHPVGEVQDMAGRFVMPGLIDAHFHAYGSELNPALLDRITPQLRSLHAKVILEGTLRRGFTTVRDAAGGDISLAKALQLGLIDGPRLFYSGLALSQTGGHGDARAPDYHGLCSCAYSGALSMVVDGPDEVRRAVREQLRQGANQIKLFVSGGVLSPSDPYWMNQLTDEEIRVAVEEAATRQTYVMAHAHTNEATLRCLRNGVRSIEHATELAPDGARAVADCNAYAVPTLAIIDALRVMGAKLGIPADMLRKAEAVGSHALRSLELLRQAGAQIGFGTDLLGPAMDMQLHEFALRREVCQPIEILRSATSVNAALLQMPGRLGVIATGAYADILAINGNPLNDITLMERPGGIAMVMRAGKIIHSAAI